MANRRQGQSRCLTKKEIQDVIQFQKNSRHSIRNICLVNMSVLLGMRVGEIANLKMNQVVNDDWSIKDQVVLLKEHTKSKKNRVVYLVHKEVRKSLTDYINYRKESDGNVRSNPFLENMKKYFLGRFHVKIHIKSTKKVSEIAKTHLILMKQKETSPGCSPKNHPESHKLT